MSNEEPWLVLGLGNPGSQYSDTRHNVGRETVQLLAQVDQQKFRKHSSGLMVADRFLGEYPLRTHVYLAYATTFMNVTGPQVASYMRALKLNPEHLLVVHDDLDLTAHLLRLKKGGGEGGHNGLRSLSASLGTKNYARLRIGVGRPPGRMDAAKYVLQPVAKDERVEWAITKEKAAEVVIDVVERGFVEAQQTLHTNQ